MGERHKAEAEALPSWGFETQRLIYSRSEDTEVSTRSQCKSK